MHPSEPLIVNRAFLVDDLQVGDGDPVGASAMLVDSPV
jgi:hypothetical protein